MRIAIVTNHDWFFISHRLPIALAALREGHEVYLLAIDTGRRKELEDIGIKFVSISLNPTGKNPVEEMRTLWELRKLYKRIKPDVIHHVTMKVTLLGSLAAKSLGIKAVVNAISGLGFAFTDGRKGFLQKIIKAEMFLAYKSQTEHFILQNPDDLRQMKILGYVPEKNVHLIKGSGVNLNLFAYKLPHNKEKQILLFPARILGDKGVYELIEAMRSIREEIVTKAKLLLAGDCSSTNPTVIKEMELKSMLEPGYIEWIGFQKDMASIYAQSDIVVLPSYREGLPKSLIETCSIGRPIITTDVPGCRECVIEGYNGMIVPVKDPISLAKAILKMVNNRDLQLKMGCNSRKMAEQEFSIDKVIDKHFEIYRKAVEGI
ncbi:glycosyltransferase family 4 protein [uncultured Bacteroides sp.]|uniref:glycosyltransferase family 4 protein n=1 Tax=uncultured Bacteroides sp. TaxID=162156 RepID=UPI0025CEBA00|nr:glycosyltransferase family 4 protein [uncultured Bacteroides sp.]